jgi:hypothetical protein
MASLTAAPAARKRCSEFFESQAPQSGELRSLSASPPELIYHLYFADPTRESEIENTISRNLEVVREDFGICMETHKSYATGAYSAGPLSPRHDGVSPISRNG